MLRFYIVFIIIGFSFACMGQKLLFHKNNHREAIYQEGDILTFNIKGSKAKITGEIVAFEDSVIVFEDFKINPGKISHLYVDKKTKPWYIFRYKYKSIFLIGGVGYLLLDVFNTGKLNEESIIIGSSLIATGLLARWLISDRIKIKGRRKLLIIH